MKHVITNKCLNELQEEIQANDLGKELNVDVELIDQTAQELYAKNEPFNQFSDDEIVALAIMCQICKENPYGKEYDDEVFDELNSRSNFDELNNKIDEIAPKYCHSLYDTDEETELNPFEGSSTPQKWFVVQLKSGTVKYPLVWYETEQEAENFCNENGWEWTDEIGFDWELDVQEMNISEDELMSKTLIRDTVSDDDDFDESYDLLSGTHVECYSDYYIAKSRAEELGLKEAEYGDTKTWSFCSWNETGDRNDDEKVIAYYKFVDRKPCALNEKEREDVAKEFGGITFDNEVTNNV